MTADVELLPVAVSPYTDRILAAVRKQDCVDPLFRILDDYARANIAHATAAQAAEIEALRAERDLLREAADALEAAWAEVERQKQWVTFWENFALQQSTHAEQAEARAERLAEAIAAVCAIPAPPNYELIAEMLEEYKAHHACDMDLAHLESSILEQAAAIRALAQQPPAEAQDKWKALIGKWQQRAEAAGYDGIEGALEAAEAQAQGGVEAVYGLFRAIVDAGGPETIARLGVERGSREWTAKVRAGLLAIERQFHPERFDEPAPSVPVGVEGLLEIAAKYVGKTSSAYRYIADDLQALAQQAAPQSAPLVCGEAVAEVVAAEGFYGVGGWVEQPADARKVRGLKGVRGLPIGTKLYLAQQPAAVGGAMMTY